MFQTMTEELGENVSSSYEIITADHYAKKESCKITHKTSVTLPDIFALSFGERLGSKKQSPCALCWSALSFKKVMAAIAAPLSL